jgi:phosphoglycerol transferase MdoB-like AlkP superfamily enzyme
MANFGKSPRWLYLLPAIHLGLTAFAIIGLELQQVPNYPSRVWDFLVVVDFPISLGVIIFGWRSGWLSAVLMWTCMLVVGTLWWYLLSLCAYRLILGIRTRIQGTGSLWRL